MGPVRAAPKNGAEEAEWTMFSSRCARVRLTGVVVQNRGIDWQDERNVYWQHKVSSAIQLCII